VRQWCKKMMMGKYEEDLEGQTIRKGDKCFEGTIY
jgi:hypothetical protein